MSALSIEEVKKILPHRYPFLLVDRVTFLSPFLDVSENREGREAIGIKNISFNEPQFTGHFPHQAVMPGVLILEAMAQMGALANYHPDDKDMDYMIGGVENVKFRKPVVPGDQVTLKAKIHKDRGRMKKILCQAEVDGELVAQADVLAVSSPRPSGA